MAVYLLHLEPPLRHSQHYIGYARDERQLKERVRRHQNGTGGVLPKYAILNGSRVELAHVWPETPKEFEKYLKTYGGATRYCPICKVNSRPIPLVKNMKLQESPVRDIDPSGTTCPAERSPP